ncbi:MAG: hypothetical protein Q7T71_03975, partial [Herbiconiux sp.]|nr:hypothetical protein [Herbiconiux sp.]
ALVSASAGATVGHLLLTLPGRRSGRRFGVAAAVLPLLAVVAGLLLAAELSILLPQLLGSAPTIVMKKLWTPPFALRVAAGTAVAILVGHLILDRRRVGRVARACSWPLVALGRNSLLVYFGSHALMSVLTRVDDSGGSVALDLAERVAVGGHVQLTWTLVVLAFWVLVASILHRLRLYLRP